ncbi:MAG: heme ABC transporter ATP-binding protein/permease CydC [Endozoicomonas sp.]
MMMNDLWYFLKLYREHMGMLALGMLLAILTLLASLSLLSLSGWFITATAIAGLTFVTAQVFNFFAPGAGVRGLSIARTAARYGERLVSHDATFRLLSSLRCWFFNKIVPISQEHLNYYRKGELLDRLVADIDALDQLYLRLLSPFIAAITVTILLSLFFSFFSAQIALMVLIIMVLWIFSMPLLFYIAGKKTGKSMGVKQSQLRQQVLDYLQGMTEQEIYGSNQTSRMSICATEKTLMEDQSTMASLEGVGSALFIIGSGSASLLVLFVASHEVILGLYSAPVMVMMVFGVLASFEALMPLPIAFQFLSHTRHAAERLRQVVDSPVVIFNEHSNRVISKGSVQFSNVRCQYGDGRSVIEGLSMDIPAGSHTAIVGKTGSGKSTLIKMMTRNLDIKEGALSIDGTSITEFSEKALYSGMTIVPQKTDVLSATLRENLHIAAPEVSDDRLLEVVHQSGLNHIAAAKTKGIKLLDLWLGQGGIALSGGEQRRLAIARALLKPSPMLILDEPGEGLDIHSEKVLMNEVFSAFNKSTIIMITHKTILLEEMDTIYVIYPSPFKLN